MTRSRRALQLSSVLALGLCLLAQLAGSVHNAAVRHVACHEHGGVVELHGGGTTTTALPSAPPREAVGAAEDGAHHAHCDRCATPSARALAVAPAPSVRFTERHPVTSPPRRLDLERIARFRLAPKGSPPRSAI